MKWRTTVRRLISLLANEVTVAKEIQDPDAGVVSVSMAAMTETGAQPLPRKSGTRTRWPEREAYRSARRRLLTSAGPKASQIKRIV